MEAVNRHGAKLVMRRGCGDFKAEAAGRLKNDLGEQSNSTGGEDSSTGGLHGDSSGRVTARMITDGGSSRRTGGM